MKKWKKIALVTIGIVLLFIGGGAYYVYHTFIPANPERIIYDKERVIEPIDKQLQDIDRNILKQKEAKVADASIEDIQNMIKHGELTYEQLTAIYLFRIKQHDQNGIALNAVTEINPHAIKEARKLDQNRAQHKQSNLYGIPIIVKDNIQTAHVMPTSAGSYVLKDWIADTDAHIIDQLKEQGAFILGKGNMSEWANFTSQKAPNGYSGKKGQNLNPYGPLEFNTDGSSSGSATVTAANFAPLAIGTETTGSIIAPAAKQSIVGLRPSLGLVSRHGIIPLSETLDTAGPMARTVKDTAILFNAMIGYDSKDSLTKEKKIQEASFDVKSLSVDGLKGKKIGILYSVEDQDKRKQTVAKKIKQDLKSAGATLVDNIKMDYEGIENVSIIKYDFKKDLNDYLEQQKTTPVKSLQDIIQYNEKDKERRIKYGQGLLKQSEDSSLTKKDFEAILQSSQNNSKKQLDKYLVEKGLDALVMINNEHVLLSAIAGYPELTVPAGYDDNGEPVGATFITKPFLEQDLFQIGYAYEQKTKNRKAPKL